MLETVVIDKVLLSRAQVPIRLSSDASTLSLSTLPIKNTIQCYASFNLSCLTDPEGRML